MVRVPRTLRPLGALVVALAACGGAAPAQSPREPRPPVDSPASDPRTPIERRRDTACDQLGPRLTACAVEDARADLAAGKVSRSQFELDTAPDIQRKNTAEFTRTCKATAYSSRQVRVLEVCPREETQCSRLLDCLGHLSDPVKPAGG
jgi:hypothetical protein